MPRPELPAARADTAALGLALGDAQLRRLLDYLDLLQRWNRTYNLTAVRDPEAMWSHHVLDSLAAAPSVLRHFGGAAPARILDVGSGGGLPGLVWGVLWPDTEIACIDAVGKKAAFIRQAAGALGLTRVRGIHARVESLAEPPYPLITSRAFASLADFTRLTRHLLADGGWWLALKGKSPDDELAEGDFPPAMFHVEPIAVPGLDADRCLVWLQAGAAG